MNVSYTLDVPMPTINSCQTAYKTPLSNWVLAPVNQDVIKLIGNNYWSTDIVVLANGCGYWSKGNINTGTVAGCGLLQQSGLDYRPSCSIDATQVQSMSTDR